MIPSLIKKPSDDSTSSFSLFSKQSNPEKYIQTKSIQGQKKSPSRSQLLKLSILDKKAKQLLQSDKISTEVGSSNKQSDKNSQLQDKQIPEIPQKIIQKNSQNFTGTITESQFKQAQKMTKKPSYQETKNFSTESQYIQHQNLEQRFQQRGYDFEDAILSDPKHILYNKQKKLKQQYPSIKPEIVPYLNIRSKSNRFFL